MGPPDFGLKLQLWQWPPTLLLQNFLWCCQTAATIKKDPRWRLSQVYDSPSLISIWAAAASCCCGTLCNGCCHKTVQHLRCQIGAVWQTLACHVMLAPLTMLEMFFRLLWVEAFSLTLQVTLMRHTTPALVHNVMARTGPQRSRCLTWLQHTCTTGMLQYRITQKGLWQSLLISAMLSMFFYE